MAFDDVHVEATGAVYYRIWAAPRARSICGHLEVKVQRGFVVSFWKPVCLAASLCICSMARRAPLAPAIARSDRTSAAAIDVRRTPSTRHTLAFLAQVWACLAFNRLDAAGPSRRRTLEVGFTFATCGGRGGALAGDGGEYWGYLFPWCLGGEASRFTSGRPRDAFEGRGAPGLGEAVDEDALLEYQQTSSRTARGRFWNIRRRAKRRRCCR